MDLEYVASGVGGYMRLTNTKFSETPSEVERFNRVMRKLADKGHDHSYSLLYNAHTEQSFGRRFKANHSSALRGIYADSGGLQILTQGLSIDDKMKHKVYHNQGTWADYGMSFDEIPVQFDGESTSRNAVEGRWFDPDSFVEKAKETGRNINDQINAFKEMGSDCKPMFITQGNCLETYKEWTQIAMDQVHPDNIEHIGGVAMGAAALGPGNLEDIKRAFYYTQLPCLEHLNHVHILGVGSVRRLIPFLAMSKSGLYKPDCRVSYDSTSHTSAPHLGSYYINDKMVKYSRDTRNPFYERMYNDIKETCGDDLYLDFETFKKAINIGTKEWEKQGGDPLDVVNAFQMSIFASIDNFTNHVYRCSVDEEAMVDMMKGRQRPAIRALAMVRDEKDFFEWERLHGNYITSKAYPGEKINTLEDMF